MSEKQPQSSDKDKAFAILISKLVDKARKVVNGKLN
jgi:hypothetical protein